MADGNGFSFKAPGFEGGITGRWGAVLVLVSVALVVIVVGLGWAAVAIEDSIRETAHVNQEGHGAIIGLLEQIRDQEQESRCLQAIPPDDDERLAAVRSEGGVCHYVLNIYRPKSGAVIPPAGRPAPKVSARPRPTLPLPKIDLFREPPPERQGPVGRERPSFPSSGFPAHP